MHLGVIIPVGPGHEAFAEEAETSVRDAWVTGRGPFDSLSLVVVDDTAGRLGRSAARNLGMDTEPAAFHFLLDADDRMLPHALGLVDLAASATFGAVCLNGKVSRANVYPVTRHTLFARGAKGTLSMGCFVRGDLGLRFDTTLDRGEDFDFYLRLPDFTKRREPLVSIGYDRPSAGGPRGYADIPWTEICADIIRRYQSAQSPATA